MRTIYILTLANLKIIVRNRSGIFWTLVMPAFIFAGLSVLPVDRFVSTRESYSSFLLPGILAMVIMQGGIYGLAYWLVDLKTRGVLKRFTVTPITRFQLVAGIVAARLSVMYVQVVILTLLGVLAFSSYFSGDVLWVIIHTALGGTLFLLLGLLIATFADTYEAAAPITAGVGLPLTFLGNIFYPVDNLPQVLRIVSEILPVTHTAAGMRLAFLEPLAWQAQTVHTAWQVGWLILAFLAVYYRFKLAD